MQTPPHLAYAKALAEEWEQRKPSWSNYQLQTIYVGGGTPSLWRADAVRQFFGHLDYDIDQISEFTVEYNPECLQESEHLQPWLEAGANRVSLGAQSLSAPILKWLGRMHDRKDILHALKILEHSDVAHVTADLIYGVPGRTPEMLQEELDILIQHSVIDHLSVYELTWEPGTPLQSARRAGRRHPASDDAIVDEYELVHEVLTGAGFEQYEVSSYAREGGRAQHNQGYWTGRPYAGIGVGAHSMNRRSGKVSRMSNIRNLRKYLSEGHAFEEVEHLQRQEILEERCMLGLRTTHGVDLDLLQTWIPDSANLTTSTNLTAALSPLWEKWESSGLGHQVNSRFQPNTRGLLYSDTLTLELIEAIAELLGDENDS